MLLYGISNPPLTLSKLKCMDRRAFVLGTLGAGSLLMLPPWARSEEKYNRYLAPLLNPNVDMAPLQRLSSFGGSSEIEGDNQDEAHEIFWDKDGYLRKKGGMPAVSADYDVVIIGGGMAGLSSAYYLQGKKVLLLEGNPRLGGNSKSQVYNKSYVSQGAAYITMPESGDEIDQFLTSLRLKNSFRDVEHTDEMVIMNGKFMPGFWDGSSDPARADEFRAVYKKLVDVYENAYPEIPVWESSASSRRYFNSLDVMSFTAWLEREFGTLHPHIMEYITLYCWSSFSASPSEISAAQGLNFLACDMGGIKVLPGGNGLITEAMYQALKRNPNITMVTNSFAVDVRSEGGKAVVCFKDPSNQLVTIRAKQCIVASSKMVMKKVITGLAADQLKAMGGISYRAYLVANVFLRKKVRSVGYDSFALKGSVPRREQDDSRDRVFADVVCADWALKDVANQSILTLYLPLPYDMAQQYLFVPNLYEKYQGRVMTALTPVLSQLGLSGSDVQGMRLVRYGHSMPVARTGGVASGLFEKAHQSIDNCIHFANQDNWGNPCFETSFGCALETVRKIL